jgi:GGDEF domain-containing protein
MSCREDEAVRKATDLQAAFAESEDASGLPAGVGLSIGCAEVTADVTDITPIVKIADERMYRNKKRA